MNDQVIASDEPARRKHTARQAHARLAFGQHAAGHAGTRAACGVGRHIVEAGDADDLLDQIGGAMNVGPPARRRAR